MSLSAPVRDDMAERPWQPHERNYSGNRVGVRHEEEWTILSVLSGIAETTTSIRSHEAWDLALRLSPALKARLEELFDGRRKAQDALYQFTWAATIAPLLRKVADDWDCDSSQCEFASSDHGGLSCPKIEAEDGCRAVEADELRQFAKALETKAALTASQVEAGEVERLVQMVAELRAALVIAGHERCPSALAADELLKPYREKLLATHPQEQP